MSVDLAGFECEAIQEAVKRDGAEAHAGLWSCYANATAGGRSDMSAEGEARLCEACRAYHVQNLLEEERERHQPEAAEEAAEEEPLPIYEPLPAAIAHAGRSQAERDKHKVKPVGEQQPEQQRRAAPDVTVAEVIERLKDAADWGLDKDGQAWVVRYPDGEQRIEGPYALARALSCLEGWVLLWRPVTSVGKNQSA